MDSHTSQQLLQSIVDHSSASIAVVSLKGDIVFTNDRWLAFAQDNGLTSYDWRNSNYIDVCKNAAQSGDSVSQAIIEAFKAFAKGRQTSFQIDYPCHSPSEKRWFRLRAVPIRVDTLSYILFFHEKYETNKELVESQRRLKIAAEAAGIGIWQFNIPENQLIWDSWMYQLYGIAQDDFSGAYEAWTRGVHPEDRDQAELDVQDAISGKRPFDTEFRIVKPSGEMCYLMGKAQVFHDSTGQPSHMIGVNIDISDNKAATEQLRQLALFDSLTGLANRNLLNDRLAQSIAMTARRNCFGAVLFLDLDKFKMVNDLVGHDVGDELLISVANRLSKVLRDEDSLGRFGGDEFVVILSRLHSDEAASIHMAKLTCQRILATLSAPFKLSSGIHNTASSIGVSMFIGNDISPALLFRQADLAMYKAKAHGGNCFHFFDVATQDKFERWAIIDNVLRDALVTNSLELYFQPQISQSGQLIGCEALLRLTDENLGSISPNEFIPIAEENGLIIEIGDWVIDQACIAYNTLEKTFPNQQLVVSINVSARQLFSGSFLDNIAQRLKNYNVPANGIKIELTEGVLVSNLKEAHQQMAGLQNAGHRISLDDFGTGYSSLSYLARLPIDELKIDRSFVQEILHDSTANEIARSIVMLAHALELTVVAEGVEKIEQEDLLVQLGCQYLQGYLYSKPISMQDFINFVYRFKSD